MIEFIILSKELEKIKKIINNKLMNYDYQYKILKEESINDNYKVYIVDSYNINVIRKIRYEENDWKSMVIIIAENEKTKKQIYETELMILSIIINDTKIESSLLIAISKSLMNYESHPNKIKFKYRDAIYIIEMNSIMYIEKEKDNKRCVINTKNNKYYIQGSLQNIMKMLDKRFIKCSRSYIVNVSQIKIYNRKKNIIIFNDNSYITEISRNEKNTINEFIYNLT